MKILIVSLVALCSGLGVGYSAQDKEKKPQDAGATKGMEMQMPKPGPEHAMLMKGVGSWDAVVTCPDPATGKPTTSKGTMTTTAHGQFCTIDTFEGEFQGQKFTGHGINGYCPVKKQYYTFWTDSCSPSPTTLWGNYDASTKQLTYNGDCVGMDGKPAKCKAVYKHKDDDHCTFTMTCPGMDGKDSTMTIEYTRKK